MEKRSLVSLFGIFFLILNLKSVYAVGLTPAIININFQPGTNYSIGYTVLEENPEIEIEIYAEGELTKYVEIDKKNIKGAGSFTVFLRMPDKIDTPGSNRITIGVREKPPEEEEGMGTATAINGALYIFVPYPGKYIDITDFSVSDVNVGEPLSFKLEIINHGEESVTATASLEIYKDKEKIDTINLGDKLLESTQKKTFKKQVDSSKYGPGEYNATVTVNYGNPNRVPRTERIFRIGSLFVDIINWTREFYVRDINKFVIEVESNWNNPIDKVYAQVFVYSNEPNKTDSILTEFKTTPESLEKWHTTNLTGHLEAYNIKEPGIYKTNISVLYETSSTTKIVDITGKKRTNITFIVIGISVFILIALTIIILIIRKRRKNKKTYKDEKNSK